MVRSHRHAVLSMPCRTRVSGVEERGYALDRFDMDGTALRAHVGAGFITEHHSRARIVVGHPSRGNHIFLATFNP
jgi:acetylornithine deacetylase